MKTLTKESFAGINVQMLTRDIIGELFIRSLIHDLRHQIVIGKITTDDLRIKTGLASDQITTLISAPILSFPTPYFTFQRLLAIWVELGHDITISIAPAATTTSQIKLEFHQDIERGERVDLHDPELG
jgi:hypothetical protein